MSIMGGANDVADFLDNVGSQAARLQGVDPVYQQLQQMVQILWSSGARNILLAKVPDLSLTPRFHGSDDARALSEQFAVDLQAIDASAAVLAGLNLNLDVLDFLDLQ